MGEDFDPLTTDRPSVLISHQSILKAMLGLVAVGAIMGFLFGGIRWGAGLLFGGLLAFANYFWLDRSTRAIFRSDAGASTSILAMQYILRYAALGLVLLAVYLTNAFPVTAVILGLAVFAFAVVVQGLKSIISSSF
ncbi:MAG: ATP synthase subunit I [Pyrinomonadaceae bacterium]